MKDFLTTKRILGMDILRDRANSTLKISQEGYLKKIVDISSQSHAKIVSTPISA